MTAFPPDDLTAQAERFLDEVLAGPADEDVVTPAACRHCPHDARDHMQRWAAGVGWHQWTEPTDQQRLARMRARRAVRKEAS